MSQTHARADLLRAMCDAAQRGHVDVVCQTLSTLGFEPRPEVEPQPGVGPLEAANNGRAVDNLNGQERSVLHLSVRLALWNDWDQVVAAFVARAPDGLECFQFARHSRPRGNSVVDMAVSHGSASTVNSLLKMGIGDPFLAARFQSAAYDGHLDVVRVILRHNGDPNTRLHLGCSAPLYWAASQGHKSVVKCLLAHKASQHGGTAFDCNNPNPALSAAVKHGFTAIAALLRRSCAKIKNGGTENAGK